MSLARLDELLDSLSPFEKGEVAERLLGHKYKRVRWHFEWDRFVILAEPDGLESAFVYEFKMQNNPFFLPEDKLRASGQADLYGLLFGRAAKKVHIWSRRRQESFVWNSPVDTVNAVLLLESFKSTADNLLIDSEAAEEWKCRTCEMRGVCPFSPDVRPRD